MTAATSLLVALAVVSAAAALSLPEGHNGGVQETFIEPAAPTKPHIVFILFDDYGWANFGPHRDPPTPEIQTPHLDELVASGILLDKHYVYKFCSPTRSAIQSGRNPIHVNNLNLAPDVHNPKDPVSGFAAIPRNMTGIATKMAAGGYKTHMFGKWDAGMATMDHTPHGRGYMSSMHYFHHANDYWTQMCGACNKHGVVDLWLNRDGKEGPALGYNSTCGGQHNATGDTCRPGPLGDKWWGGYEDGIFQEQVLETIHEHDPTDPLFLFWAPHIVHAPLQVPDEYYEKFDFIAPTDKPKHQRQTYHAMVNFADAAVGNVTQALKDKGMFQNTLIIFSSDNGGPVYANGTAGANNYPLRGGKMSNWEGGVRVNAFASGGFIPESQRGTKYEGLVTGWDWYATISHLAGVDPTDHRAAAANLPPIDSHSMVDVLLGRNLTSPRTEIPLGTDSPGNYSTVSGLIRGDWKILTGWMHQSGWQGPHYPNSTTNTHCFSGNGPDPKNPCVIMCKPACLFNLKEDPTEHNDLASEKPEIVTELLGALEQVAKTTFNPDRGHTDPKACHMAENSYGNFWGPFVFP